MLAGHPRDRHHHHAARTRSSSGARWATAANGALPLLYHRPALARRTRAGLSAGRDFLAGAPSAMVLGDNLFFGHGLPELLAAADARAEGGTVFGYHVADPERYGVVDFDASGPRAGDRGKAGPAALATMPSRGSISSTARRPSGPGREALGARRAGDHRRSWKSISPRGACGREDGPRLRLARYRHPCELLDAGNFVRTLTERQGLQAG